MKYAVFESGGKQHIASQGKIITLDKIDKSEGEKFQFDKVLLLRQDDSLTIGTPYIEGAKVIGKVAKQYQGKKLDVMKFKGKVRYRRKIGFRAQLTDIEVIEIAGLKKSASRVDKREKVA